MLLQKHFVILHLLVEFAYAIFTDKLLNMENHFLIDYHVFPQIDISECSGIVEFKEKMKQSLSDDKAVGLWLQKKDRKLLADKYLNFEDIEKVIKESWTQFI